MNKELLGIILNLLKNKLTEFDEQQKVVNAIENLLNEDDLQDSLLNLSQEERKNILFALEFKDDEIESIENNIKILKEPVGTGEIWLEIVKLTKDKIETLISNIKSKFGVIKKEYNSTLLIYNNLIKFINILEKEEYYLVLLEDARIILDTLDLSDKEKIEFIYAIVIERSKYLKNKTTKSLDINEVESNIDMEIDDSLVQNEPADEIEDLIFEEESIFIDQDIVDKDKEFPILDSLDNLESEQSELVLKTIQIIKSKPRKNIKDNNIYDSYITLCESSFNDGQDLIHILENIYQQNKNAIFISMSSLESFLTHFMNKVIVDLYDAINLEVVNENDEKEKQSLIVESITKLNALTSFYENYFNSEIKDIDFIEQVDNSKNILIFGIDDFSSDLLDMEFNLKSDIKNALQKIHNNNMGNIHTLKIDKSIYYVIHNNVVVYFIKINDSYLILDALSTGKQNHEINSIFTLKNSKRVNDYIVRLSKDPDFYNEVLELSEKFYNDGIKPGNKGGKNA